MYYIYSVWISLIKTNAARPQTSTDWTYVFLLYSHVLLLDLLEFLLTWYFHRLLWKALRAKVEFAKLFSITHIRALILDPCRGVRATGVRGEGRAMDARRPGRTAPTRFYRNCSATTGSSPPPSARQRHSSFRVLCNTIVQ